MGLIVLGCIASGIGLLMFSMEAAERPPVWIAQLLLGLGGLLATVGSVAGVEIGLARHEWKRRNTN